MNPYEIGKAHAKNGLEYQNPFNEFSEKWALYNMGWNAEKWPDLFPKPPKTKGY